MSSEPPPTERRLRLRAVLSAQFAVILAVCLLAAAAGAGLVYTTHVDPSTETQTQNVEILTVESGYNHSAEVTEPNSVFDTGTILDNRNTYFTRIAPELDVAVETTYTAADASNVAVELDSVLVIENVGDDGVTYWSERETLAAEQHSDVASGETTSSSFSINSSEIDETVSSIESELGASPGETETYVETTVVVDGTIEGESRSSSRTIEMEVIHGGDTYTVSDPGFEVNTVDRTETVTVESTYGPLRSIGGPVLFLLGLAGMAGLVYLRRETELALTQAEREYLSYRDDRSEFAEWVTQIRLPETVHERPEASASTLRDLVDFAIDNDTGVIEDPETGAFHAVTSDLVYTYQPPLLATGKQEADNREPTGLQQDGSSLGPSQGANTESATAIDDDVTATGPWTRAGHDPGTVVPDRVSDRDIDDTSQSTTERSNPPADEGA